MILTRVPLPQDEEMGLLTEVTHLQEIMQSLCHHSADPHLLPPASEQVINDVKSADSSGYYKVSCGILFIMLLYS